MSRVSILLPFYQATETLEEAIQSVQSQTLEDWELILINDGSTDDGPNIAESYAGKDTRIRHLTLSHGGIVKALNAGLELAQTPYIARMDADDICYPQRLEQQIQLMDKNQHIGLVSSRVEHLSTNPSQQGYIEYIKWINSLITHEDIYSRRFIESPFAHPSVLFRRDLVKRYGGYQEGDFPEDYELWLRWLNAGVNMAKVPATLLKWRDLTQRLSRKDTRYRLEAFYKMKFTYLTKVLPAKPLWVWGAGKTSRKRAGWPEDLGHTVEGYYDVDPKKIGDPQINLVVKSYKELPPPGQIFLLILTSVRGVRGRIATFLKEQGWTEGVDYLFSA